MTVYEQQMITSDISHKWSWAIFWEQPKINLAHAGYRSFFTGDNNVIQGPILSNILCQ